MIRTALALLASFLACAGAHAHVGPHPEDGIAFDQRLGARVPTALPFLDARGDSTTLGRSLAGEPTVLLLGYVQCRDLCALALPGAAEALGRTGLRPGRDYRAVFASIDAREPPAVLAEAALRVPAAQRGAWSFLGGNADSAQTLARAIGFQYRYEPARDAFAHPEGLVVLAPDGAVSRYLFGVRFDASDLRLALAEAGQGRTGRVADRLLLLCYHFDPATGRYTPRILDALRILIGVCAVTAAFFGWRMVRAARRGHA